MKLNRVFGGDDMDVFRMNVVNHSNFAYLKPL